MDRLEFMKELEALLSDISQSEREEALQYYNDYLNDAGVENEQEVLDSLGTPRDLARVIKEGLADGGEKGEFTETGYRNEALGTDLKNEIARKEKTEKSGSSDGQEKGGFRAKLGKRPLSPGMIALIVLLCIFAFPILVGVAGSIIGVVCGILGTIFGLVAGAAVTGIALLAAAAGLLICGIGTLFSVPLAGICLVGLGILLAGIGMVFVWLTVWICAKAVPWVIRGMVKIGSDLLRGRRKESI